MRSLQVFKCIVTQLDQSIKLHMIATENSMTYIYSKMIKYASIENKTVNTRLFIDQLINSASLK